MNASNLTLTKENVIVAKNIYVKPYVPIKKSHVDVMKMEFVIYNMDIKRKKREDS